MLFGDVKAHTSQVQMALILEQARPIRRLFWQPAIQQELQLNSVTHIHLGVIQIGIYQAEMN